jgi:hypothetical protein
LIGQRESPANSKKPSCTFMAFLRAVVGLAGGTLFYLAIAPTTAVSIVQLSLFVFGLVIVGYSYLACRRTRKRG